MAEDRQFPATRTIDPWRLLGIRIDEEGKVKRSNRIPAIPPSATPVDGVVSKDITLEAATGLGARIFLPLKQEEEEKEEKLPVVLYFHGGGFVIFKPNDIMFHGFCVRLAKTCNAIVVSVDYRRAPENRLPAAYEDAVAALRWLGGQAAADCFDSRADFSRVYLMGDSSGANIVYNAGLRVSEREGLRVAGIVMVQPFFGGVERTASEVRLERDRILPMAANDLLWSLALPEGADRDHEFCNPLKGPGPTFPATLMVAVEELDPLLDRQLEFVTMLREKGVHVEVRRDPSGYHGIQLTHVEKAEALCRHVSNFISSSRFSSL